MNKIDMIVSIVIDLKILNGINEIGDWRIK